MVLHCTTSFFNHCMCAISLWYTIDCYSTLCLSYCSTTYNIVSYYVILVFTGISFGGSKVTFHMLQHGSPVKRLECWQMFRNSGSGNTLIFPPWCCFKPNQSSPVSCCVTLDWFKNPATLGSLGEFAYVQRLCTMMMLVPISIIH